jgi:DnaJ-domain-containing protein 1
LYIDVIASAKPLETNKSNRVSGDLLSRLFQLTRAHLGDRSSSPRAVSAAASEAVDDDAPGNGRPDCDPGNGRPDCDPGNGRPDCASQSRARRGENAELAGYYANLEIPYGSNLRTVRAAWKHMMNKYHPDLHGADAQKRQVAGELTAELTRAYQELTAVLERENQSRL